MVGVPGPWLSVIVDVVIMEVDGLVSEVHVGAALLEVLFGLFVLCELICTVEILRWDVFVLISLSSSHYHHHDH